MRSKVASTSSETLLFKISIILTSDSCRPKSRQVDDFLALMVRSIEQGSVDEAFVISYSLF